MFNHVQLQAFVQKNQKILFFISVIVLSFVIYSPSFLNENYFWDDDRFIFMNPSLIQAPNWYEFWNIKSEFFKSWPLGYSIFWLIIKNSPLSSVFFFKSLNIVFHGVNAFLIFVLNKKLKFKYSYLLSLIFLTHALNVETVSWIFQLLTILALTFFLFSLLFLINFLEKKNYSFYILSIIFFIFSLWTKSIAILSPFLFLVFFWIYQSNIKKYLLLVPFFLVSLYLGVINTAGTSGYNNQLKPQGAISSFLGSVSNNIANLSGNPQGKIINNTDKAYFDYIYQNSGKVFNYNGVKVFNQAVWHYLSKLLLPINLNYIYPDTVYSFALTGITIIILLILPVIFYLKMKNRYLLLIPSMSLVFLVPYLGITDITFYYWSNVSDRYTYFFVIVLIVAIGILGNTYKKINFNKAIVCYFFLMCGLNIHHGQKFNRPLLMYKEIVEYKPHPIIYSLLFEQYYMLLDSKNADATLKEGLEKFPGNPNLERDIMRADSLRKFYEKN